MKTASTVAPTCVVASGPELAITISDVEILRRRFVPSPERDAATRLAVDVWLAEWIATGEVGRLSLSERIRHHQHLSARHRGNWSAELEKARAALQVVHGPCYVARARTAVADGVRADPP